MKRIKYFLACLLACSFLLAPAAVSAATNDQIFQACKQAPSSTVCKDKGKTQNPLVHLINVIANIVAVAAGIAAVIMLMLGGYNFITAGGVTPGQRSGDPNKIATARKQILYALVGIIVIALAWVITRFVTDKVIQ